MSRVLSSEQRLYLNAEAPPAPGPCRRLWLAGLAAAALLSAGAAGLGAAAPTALWQTALPLRRPAVAGGAVWGAARVRNAICEGGGPCEARGRPPAAREGAVAEPPPPAAAPAAVSDPRATPPTALAVRCGAALLLALAGAAAAMRWRRAPATIRCAAFAASPPDEARPLPRDDATENAEYFANAGALDVTELSYRSAFAESRWASVSLAGAAAASGAAGPPAGAPAPVDVHYQTVVGPAAPGATPRRALLVHGFGANAASWHNVHEGIAAAAGGACAALDMPGFGLTRRPRRGVDFRDGGRDPLRNPYTTFSIAGLCAGFAEQVLGASPKEPAVLVGHSLGALVAALTAARHPELVQGLILICPAIVAGPPKPEGGPGPVARLLRLIRRGLAWVLLPLRLLWCRVLQALTVNRLTRALLRTVVFRGNQAKGAGETIFDAVLPTAVWGARPFPGRSRILEGYKTPIKAKDFDRGLLEFTAATAVHGNGIRSLDLPALGRRVKCLVIAGENDRIVPTEGAQAIAQALGCAYVQVPGSGHCPMEDSPELVLAAVRRYFRELDGPAAEGPLPESSG